jgi:hypothetical protein
VPPLTSAGALPFGLRRAVQVINMFSPLSPARKSQPPCFANVLSRAALVGRIVSFADRKLDFQAVGLSGVTARWRHLPGPPNSDEATAAAGGHSAAARGWEESPQSFSRPRPF